MDEMQQIIIEQLIDEIKFLQTQLTQAEEKLQNIRPKAEFYLTMQSRVIADPQTCEAMQRFLMIMRLTQPDDITGFTRR